MSYDATIALELLRGLAYTVGAIAAGVIVGTILHHLTAGGD